MKRNYALIVLAALAAGTPASAEEIPFARVLAVGPVTRAGRALVHRDPIEAQIVTGEWKAPKAGETVGTAAWTEVLADKDGWFRARALSGGYAFASVTSARNRIMILEAAGHGMVYVNGVPRAGDPYSYGYLRLPVELKQGENHFLFATGRGQLRARLVDPASPIMLDASDSTLPDLRVGEKTSSWGAVVAINSTGKTLNGAYIEARLAGGRTTRTALPAIPPFGARKVGFRLEGAAPSAPTSIAPIRRPSEGDGNTASTERRPPASTERRPPASTERRPPASTERRPPASTEAVVELRLVGLQGGPAPLKISLRIRPSTATYKRTFISKIDGSVQYYAVNPATGAGIPKSAARKSMPRPALVLTLHGAGVEGIGQADAYAPKAWAHIVAPTNRRPYGFDWEEWGRLDALEVADLAQRDLQTDPQRTYLTGHSMGGHGTWQLGVHYPDRFAAIAPSAGWISFFSYAGGSKAQDPDPVEAVVQRSQNASDTLQLSGNYAAQGVYILHGGADDNVPAREARTMAARLGEFHHDWSYHEQPGAGHWWSVGDEPGAQCVDWPPIFDLFARRRLPDHSEARNVRFSTFNPEIASRCRWAAIVSQIRSMELSSIDLRFDPIQRRFSGVTTNVERLTLDSTFVGPGAIKVEIDGTKIDIVERPGSGPLTLNKVQGAWTAVSEFRVAGRAPFKNPLRHGTFKAAFNHRFLFVYGTRGTEQENAWALAKARYDAETFGYRGNGSVDMIPDTEFNAERTRDRSVILYGTSESNGAWTRLLGDSPVQVKRGAVRIGDRELRGDDLACLFVRPRADSEFACVGVVSGTGMAGLRLTERVPVFLSGVGIPDCVVLSTASLTEGSKGVLAAGFFTNDWSVGADVVIR